MGLLHSVRFVRRCTHGGEFTWIILLLQRVIVNIPQAAIYYLPPLFVVAVDSCRVELRQWTPAPGTSEFIFQIR